MKKIGALPKLVIISFLVFSFIASSTNKKNTEKSPKEKYSLVKIFDKNEQDMQKIMNAGLFIDHAESHEGEYTETWLSETEIGLLKRSGVPYQTVIDDFKKYYDEQPKMTSSEIETAIQESNEDFNVSHSIYGTMGGYLTFAEVVNKLDSMRIEYPNLISQKFSIGSTVEGQGDVGC